MIGKVYREYVYCFITLGFFILLLGLILNNVYLVLKLIIYFRETIETKKEYEHDNSIQIIETNSEPNMSCVRPSLSSPNSVANVTKSDWDIKSTDDSFLRLEKMVSDMCVSPKSVNDLDNTLDVVEYILNNPVTKENDSHNNAEYFLKSSLFCNEPIIKDEETKNVISSHENLNLHKTKMEVTNDESNKFVQESPSNIQEDHNFSSHIKSENLVLPTPTKETTHVFKTPKNLLSTKKHTLTSSSKKTPNKVNAYQHITSPVAFYIRNCPQVPLIKDIHLKKPLTNASSIPKMATTPKENKINNKENILLPSVAYKSAKQTKMVYAIIKIFYLIIAC